MSSSAGASVPLLSSEESRDDQDTLETDLEMDQHPGEKRFNSRSWRNRFKSKHAGGWSGLITIVVLVLALVLETGYILVGGAGGASLIQQQPTTKLDEEIPKCDPSDVVPLNPELDRSRLAVMIEKRNMPVLIPLVLNFLVKVPAHWPFQLWVGSENEPVLRESRLLQPFIASGRLNLTRLPDESLIFDGPSLSKFLTSPWWWHQLAPAHHILFFQTDSLICAHSNQTVDDFLGLDVFEGGYDWVGAPWDLRGYPASPWGGNGGFSLRRRDVMVDLTERFEYDGHSAEDVWFANKIHETTGRFPEQDVAMAFSFESLPSEANNFPWAYKSYGMHTGTGWAICRAFHDWSHIRTLLEWCPDAKLVMPN
ncbi:hypothetical protein T439DRAFT_383623, partial [Meredithblackwellia eburnea MCA 4105]